MRAMSLGRRGLKLDTLKFNLELTSRCNLRCGMCPMDRLGRPYEDAPFSMVEKVSREMKELNLRMRYLHELGEPLLYPRLCEAIDLFPGVALSTNATLLTEDRAKEIVSSSLSRIILSLDTLDPRAYAETRRGADHRDVIENIRSFLELSRGKRVRVEIQRLITPVTQKETAASISEFFRLERYPQARVTEKTCEGLDTSDETPLHQAYSGCVQGSPFRWFVILASGEVTHCCYDTAGSQSLGNVRTRTIGEIAASVFLGVIREGFASDDFSRLPRCAECHKNSALRPAMSTAWALAQRLPAFAKAPLRRFVNPARMAN
jgi:MoaA/NifB/PqqE/SkfB family radical SAM enzyme